MIRNQNEQHSQEKFWYSQEICFQGTLAADSGWETTGTGQRVCAPVLEPRLPERVGVVPERRRRSYYYYLESQKKTALSLEDFTRKRDNDEPNFLALLPKY
jgi:hypothetical protein